MSPVIVLMGVRVSVHSCNKVDDVDLRKAEAHLQSPPATAAGILLSSRFQEKDTSRAVKGVLHLHHQGGGPTEEKAAAVQPSARRGGHAGEAPPPSPLYPAPGTVHGPLLPPKTEADQRPAPGPLASTPEGNPCSLSGVLDPSEGDTKESLVVQKPEAFWSLNIPSPGRSLSSAALSQAPCARGAACSVSSCPLQMLQRRPGVHDETSKGRTAASGAEIFIKGSGHGTGKWGHLREQGNADKGTSCSASSAVRMAPRCSGQIARTKDNGKGCRGGKRQQEKEVGRRVRPQKAPEEKQGEKSTIRANWRKQSETYDGLSGRATMPQQAWHSYCGAYTWHQIEKEILEEARGTKRPLVERLRDAHKECKDREKQAREDRQRGEKTWRFEFSWLNEATKAKPVVKPKTCIDDEEEVDSGVCVARAKLETE